MHSRPFTHNLALSLPDFPVDRAMLIILAHGLRQLAEERLRPSAACFAARRLVNELPHSLHDYVALRLIVVSSQVARYALMDQVDRVAAIFLFPILKCWIRGVDLREHFVALVRACRAVRPLKSSAALLGPFVPLRLRLLRHPMTRPWRMLLGFECFRDPQVLVLAILVRVHLLMHIFTSNLIRSNVLPRRMVLMLAGFMMAPYPLEISHKWRIFASSFAPLMFAILFYLMVH